MNKRGNLIVKNRQLRPYLGVVGDNLYNSTSSDTYGWSVLSADAARVAAMSVYRTFKAARDTPNTSIMSWPLGYEEIHTTSGRSNLGMKNCLHTMQRAVQYPYLAVNLRWNFNAGPYSTDNLNQYWRETATGSYMRDACERASQHAHQYDDDQMFSARAYWSMRPKFQSDVSLINTIFELKDFSDVASVMFGKNNSLNNIAKRFTAFATHMLKTTLSANKNSRKYVAKAIGSGLTKAKAWLTQPGAVVRDLTQAAASARLTWALAIMPTVQDTIAIHAAAQKDVYELARQFKQYGDEGARSHYSEVELLENTIVPGNYNYQYWGSGLNVLLRRTATMISYYDVLWQRIEDRYPKWWGLEIGADEVWNMLPLSFVIDYMLTIGKSLEYMDRDDSVEIHRYEYCESTKVLVTFGQHYVHNARTSALVIDDKYIEKRQYGSRNLLVTGTEGMYYKRRVMEPYKGPALPKLKLPSKSQAVNMLALARCLLF